MRYSGLAINPVGMDHSLVASPLISVVHVKSLKILDHAADAAWIAADAGK